MTRAPATTSLPVLDMSQLDRGDTEAANFRTALRTATHDVGFFYLVGHGIPEDVTARAFAEATRFFARNRGGHLQAGGPFTVRVAEATR